MISCLATAVMYSIVFSRTSLGQKFINPAIGLGWEKKKKNVNVFTIGTGWGRGMSAPYIPLILIPCQCRSCRSAY